MTTNYRYSLNGNAYSNFVTPHIDTNNINIAIIQPGSWGDNINSTMMLIPLKNKYPSSQIDVYTTKQYASAFHNNTFIDNIISADIEGKNDSLNFVHVYPPLLENKGYTHIINASPFINPNDWSSGLYPQLGENLMLSWCKALEKINVHYDLPLRTILMPTIEEKKRAESKILPYVTNSKIKNLAEIHGESGQTFWNHEWTEKVVQKLVDFDQVIFISHNGMTDQIKRLQSKYPLNVLYVGDLSIRECTYVFNQCDRFFSVSSGLSNACNTNYCKTSIRWVEVVNSLVCSSAPIRKEGKVFWHDNNITKFIDWLSE